MKLSHLPEVVSATALLLISACSNDALMPALNSSPLSEPMTGSMEPKVAGPGEILLSALGGDEVDWGGDEATTAICDATYVKDDVIQTSECLCPENSPKLISWSWAYSKSPRFGPADLRSSQGIVIGSRQGVSADFESIYLHSSAFRAQVYLTCE